MLNIPGHAVPWIITLIAVLFVLGLLAWAGYPNWSEPP